MSFDPPHHTRPLATMTRTFGRFAFALATRSAIMGILWIVLTGGDRSYPWLAIATIAIAALASVRTIPIGTVRLRPIGFARFTPFFLAYSARAGFDVARRAIWQPSVPDAGIVVFRLHLADGPARFLFVAALGLFPGSLVARVEADTVRIHVLDTSVDNEPQLRALERRAGDLFAET